MDKNIIIRSLKGVEVQTQRTQSQLWDYSAWGTAKFTEIDDYIMVSRNSSTGGWGIVTSQDETIFMDTSYTVEFDYLATDLSSLAYCYIISRPSGNVSLPSIPIKPDGKWHTIKREISTDKDRYKAGILIGSDYRQVSGESFKIKNFKLYPTYLESSEKREVKEILTLKNGRWEKTINYLLKESLNTDKKTWVEFLRPEIQLKDTPNTTVGLKILKDNTLREDKLGFNSLKKITIRPINPNLIKFNEIYTTAEFMDKSKYEKSGEIVLTTEGTYQGVFIRYHDVEPNTTYSFSYKYEVLEGELLTFGGHADATYYNNKCYLNGKYMTDNYNEWDSTYDPETVNEINHVHVVINTPKDVVPMNRLFIQPNRGKTDRVKVKIYDMKFEKGDMSTLWIK